ncbi:MAG TPA: carbohydrate porin [Kofleriaceae bacterium]|nr:carbohydrate porin [Kofleriaceae bacterium]
MRCTCKTSTRRLLRLALALAAGALAAAPARADDAYLLDHPDAPWWLSGQLNVIGQAQPGFHAPYTGDNSFRPDNHDALSYVATAYAGYEVTPTTAIVVAIESAGGGGLSDALGIAGFTNLDVVRNPTLGAAPYLGRAFIDQIIPLSDTRAAHDRDPLHVLRALPERRIELRAGKLSTVDQFDVNAIASDSHLQFMNWAIDNTGAYDYAADTRGYTLGATAEYAEPGWALRLGELLMPTVANGIDYDFDVAHARGENLEIELHDQLGGHPGTLRLLGYVNHANMGSYADAIAAVQRGEVAVPDITASRQAGRIKYGAGLNAEHELGADLRGFVRMGWSDGHTESFAYTEVDSTVVLGGDLRGTTWQRDGDKLGLAAVSNGLSDAHRRYLALGGKGFLLGDGRLRYGRETIVETYYTARLHRGTFAAADFQLIARPGYNRDRGPITVGSLRLHVEL